MYAFCTLSRWNAHRNNAPPRSTHELGENMANSKTEIQTLLPRALSCQTKKEINAIIATISGQGLSTLKQAADIQKPGIDTMKTTASRINAPCMRAIRFSATLEIMKKTTPASEIMSSNAPTTRICKVGKCISILYNTYI